MFDFAVGESRTLAGFRRVHNATADKTLSPGGFYQRLTPLFATYLRDLVQFTLDEVVVPPVCDELDQFRDMITDATVLRLHRFLREQYRGRHEEQAAHTFGLFRSLNLVGALIHSLVDYIAVTVFRSISLSVSSRSR